MPSHAPISQESFSQHFQRQLIESRRRIETLPERERPYFRSLADEAERHHRSMQNGCAAISELIDDMRLTEAATKFDVWAGSRNIQNMFGSHGE